MVEEERDVTKKSPEGGKSGAESYQGFGCFALRGGFHRFDHHGISGISSGCGLISIGRADDADTVLFRYHAESFTICARLRVVSKYIEIPLAIQRDHPFDEPQVRSIGMAQIEHIARCGRASVLHINHITV